MSINNNKKRDHGLSRASLFSKRVDLNIIRAGRLGHLRIDRRGILVVLLWFEEKVFGQESLDFQSGTLVQRGAERHRET
jgi:hypothetical protein